jgi:hypothetical protein
MSTHWSKTIATLNEYLNTLKSNNDVNVLLTLAFFDKEAYPNFNRLYNDGSSRLEPILQYKYMNASNWTEFSANDKSIAPRGMTPLYDAICEFGSTPKKNGLKKTDLVQFVIITDGDENVSTEHSLEDTKKLLAKYEKKNWPVTYLGATLEAFNGGAKIVSNLGTLNAYNPVNFMDTARSLVGSSIRYAATASASASYMTDEEKTAINS